MKKRVIFFLFTKAKVGIRHIYDCPITKDDIYRALTMCQATFMGFTSISSLNLYPNHPGSVSWKLHFAIKEIGHGEIKHLVQIMQQVNVGAGI